MFYWMLAKQAFLNMSAHTLTPNVFILFNLVLKKMNNCKLEGLGSWETTTDHREHCTQRPSHQFSTNSCSNPKKTRFQKKCQKWFNPSETRWWHFFSLDPFSQSQRLRIHILHFSIRYKQGLSCDGCEHFIIVLSINYLSEKSVFQN